MIMENIFSSYLNLYYKEYLNELNLFINQKLSNSLEFKNKIKKNEILEILDEYKNKINIKKSILNNIRKEINDIMIEYSNQIICDIIKIIKNNKDNYIEKKDINKLLSRLVNNLNNKKINNDEHNIKKKSYYNEWKKEFVKNYNDIKYFIDIPENIKNNKKEIIKLNWSNLKKSEKFINLNKNFKNNNFFEFYFINNKNVNCSNCNLKIIYDRGFNKCVYCNNSFYCSIQCQSRDWDKHKVICEHSIKNKLKSKKNKTNNNKKNIGNEVIYTTDDDNDNNNDNNQDDNNKINNYPDISEDELI